MKNVNFNFVNFIVKSSDCAKNRVKIIGLCVDFVNFMCYNIYNKKNKKSAKRS